MPEEFIEIMPFARELFVMHPCPYCKLRYKLSDIAAQGNRRGTDGLSYYYYEAHCSACNQPSMTVVTSRRMDTKGLWKALGEYYEGADAANGSHYAAATEGNPESTEAAKEESSKPQPSKISDEEVEQLRQLLEKAESFEDVLNGLGISDVQLRAFMEWGKRQDDISGDSPSK